MDMKAVAMHVEFQGISKLEFNKPLFRKALKQSARGVRDDAKRLLARRAISQPGEYPGMKTGDTRKSVYVRLSRSKWSAIVEPQRTPHMTSTKFYPQILIKGRNKRKLEPRRDPVKDALEARREEIQKTVFEALQDAITAA